MKSIYVATIEDFHKVININLLGVTLCFQYAARQMIKQGRGGRIIGASSGAGKQGRFALHTHICISWPDVNSNIFVPNVV